jgi:hypothetical protein
MAWRFSSSSLSFSSQCRPVATIKSLSQAPPPTQHSIASRAPRLLESLRRVRTGRLCPRRATQLSNHGDQESHTDLQCAPLSKRSGSQSAAFQFDFSPVLPFHFVSTSSAVLLPFQGACPLLSEEAPLVRRMTYCSHFSSSCGRNLAKISPDHTECAFHVQGLGVRGSQVHP